MARIVCPGCRADLDDDLIASTGAAQCPFCGANLSGVDFAPEDPPLTPFEDILEAETAFSGTTDETEVSAPPSPRREAPSSDGTGSALRAELPLPPKSRIEVVESTPDRRVIFVPAGGKGTAAIGFFAVVWNGFMTLFTSILLFATNQGNQQNPPPWYVLVPFLGLFWAVGLGFLYFWIRMKFTRTYLLLETDRLVAQRILFGRRKVTETFVGPETRASLSVAYEQNDQPVYCIEINGTNRTEKFGTSLSNEEKNWFVDSINGFLGAAGVPAACEAVLDSTGGEIVQTLAPKNLPSDSTIVIDDASTEHLAFHLPAVPAGQKSGFLGCAGTFFVVVPLVINFIFWFSEAEIGLIAHGMLFFMPVLGLIVLVMIARGSLNVDLTRERLSVRWKIGPFRFGRELANSSIERIAILEITSNQQNERLKQRRQAGQKPMKVCQVVSGATKVALSGMFNDMDCSRQAGGLVRYQLEQMGFPLEDA